MASSSPGDLNVSMTRDSDELHEMYCEQCDLHDEREIADGFCVDSMEYMCKSCLKYHKRQNPNHTQQNKDTMPQDFCFEKCATHSKKLIKYYCFLCKRFACSDCKRTEHEKCTGIGHVPTLAKGVENCDEFNRLFKSIEDVTEELSKTKEVIVMKMSQSNSQKEKIIEAAEQQREEMNKRLDEQKQLITYHYDKEIEKAIEKLETERKEKINQMYDKQRQVDDLQHEVLEEELKKVELRTKTEKDTLNVLLMKNEKISTDTKQLSDDIELKKKMGDRSKIFIAMMEAKQNLSKQEKEWHQLQSVTRGRYGMNTGRSNTASELQLTFDVLTTLCKIIKVLERRQLKEGVAVEICKENRSSDVFARDLYMLQDMCVCCEGSTFKKLWYSQCQEVGGNCSTLNDVIHNVWRPVKKRWDTQQIKSGEIKFRDFEKVIGNRYKKEYHTMAIEMKTLQLSDTVIKKRLDQLKEYRKLDKESYAKAAMTLLMIAKDYKLQGDFQQIRIVANHGENDLEMRSFDDSVINACNLLKEVTPQREACLKMFGKCIPLVQWLKESMKSSGLKELKVFVDLAFMSAGGEPINIARVQCLHSAVTGYAPLIFELKPTSGYEELLKHCAVVWKELDANPKLPEKLRDTTRQLQWLKEIKKAHGSVEVTPLMEVEVINANGIFLVSKNARKKETVLTAGDIIKLTVPEQEGRRQLRNYTFSQCQDLQSRLMLVAGKTEKDTDSVDRFTMILESITKLSNIYIKLCSSGCVLFKDLTARLFCDPKPDRPVCTILKFGQGEGVPQLKVRRSEDIIPELANFMESCLKEWLQHIKEKRKTYPHLNYFTVDQLVILQRELVKMRPESEPSHLVYPLLSAVKANCTPDDLVEAMAAAKEEIYCDIGIEPEGEDDSGNNEMETGADATEDEKKHNIIQELVQSGYDEELAIRPIQFVETEDVTAGTIWFKYNEEDPEFLSDFFQSQVENEPMAEHVSHRHAFAWWSQSQTDLQTLINTYISGLNKQNDVGSPTLRSDLTSLWKQFLESISSNIRDYLSLEHLGIILKYLARKSATKISRSLPPGLREGEPNLIICPSGDVLMTTLSVYMMDINQPLPQSDEILLCTSDTTIDEVDILWRRAIFDEPTKIHCMVNPDLLTYEVSAIAETYLKEYLLEGHCKDLKYRLLVICGSENEYRSPTVLFLEKFKRQPFPANTAYLRHYLALKLTMQQRTISGIKPAAHIDKQSSTVRVIESSKAGMGKSLYKQRRKDELCSLNGNAVNSYSVTIPLQSKIVDIYSVTQILMKYTTHPAQIAARLFHIDIFYQVENGLDYLLFNMIVLGCLVDKKGFVWRKSPTDIFLIETISLMVQTRNRREGDLGYLHSLLEILPVVTCRSPMESLKFYSGEWKSDTNSLNQLFDEEMFRSEVFQRPYQYLLRLDKKQTRFESVCPQRPEGNPASCLQTLVQHCGVRDPSWADLNHFVLFLNQQLIDFEHNAFVSEVAAEDLPGFSMFALKSIIKMSRDFSTRSLCISDESAKANHANLSDQRDIDNNEHKLMLCQNREMWENRYNPYLFFNSDRSTFTFLGFCFDPLSGNIIDPNTKQVLASGVMDRYLYNALVANKAPVSENFDNLSRAHKLDRLSKVMGIDMPHDPDSTFILTSDTVKKIMAIHMRFRVNIPVVIMGETGCGKTSLVKFMCALQIPPRVEYSNIIHVKVSECSAYDIFKKVDQAYHIAEINKEMFGVGIYTVVLFDGANTTENIVLIKEIMCDRSIQGKQLLLCESLKFVAVCNPYKKKSEELINGSEWLRFQTDAEDTSDTLGRVPVRQLLYNVQPFPQSLISFVWDFGQLNTQVEDIYTKEMVRRYIYEDKLPNTEGLIEVVSAVLTTTHDFMRKQKDECSFVSLRDVDRVLIVMSWFYQQSEGERTIYDLMDYKLYGGEDYSSTEEDSDEENEQMEIDNGEKLDDVTRSLILALGVCYHASLKNRPQYRSNIAKCFHAPCLLPGGDDQIKEELESCQEVFLDHVHLEKKIARNMTLRENVFLMVVCIELRIPLFLVGKPGSSKSLAKSIVSDAMQGNAAREELFRELKQAQMVSFQCSPLSTLDGIVGTFKQCAQFQKDKDLDTFVSIVVLGHVGLAEDCHRMPLRTLRHLLEDGCQGDSKKHKKVACIGISNRALDPAKTNRGILVQKEVPGLEELQNTASGICSTVDELRSLINPLITPIAISYLEIFEKASQRKREFYGLRDFYSLVKMVYSFVEKSQQKPTWHEMLYAIKRNFGGLDQVNPVEIFKKNLATVVLFEQNPKPTDPDCTPAGLVEACLFDKNEMHSESRYLLLLTENYGALTVIQHILSRNSDIRPLTIFGSSFRGDQEYTQMCRNINKIKVCMETGKTVVLLNLENLYESLYDALNQYYVYFGGERYVDLGLGIHRVKCPVHKMFRLIVVAEKQTVYDKFPTPLINRLEKHVLTNNTMLSSEQQEVANKLEDWAKQFVVQRLVGYMHRGTMSPINIGNVFIGFHEDTCSAIILHVWNKYGQIENEKDRDTQVLQEAKIVLIWCATPESLVRLDNSTLPNHEKKLLNKWYFETQAHDNLIQYLNLKIVQQECNQLFAQITTHSKLMAGTHKREISYATGMQLEKILLLETLSSFDTEQQFSNRIQQHMQTTDKHPSLMIIQCDAGDTNANLIACARYCVMTELEKMRDELRAPVHIVFIIQLPRGASFTGFQCGIWHSAHIDDLYTEDMNMPTLR